MKMQLECEFLHCGDKSVWKFFLFLKKSVNSTKKKLKNEKKSPNF